MKTSVAAIPALIIILSMQSCIDDRDAITDLERLKSNVVDNPRDVSALNEITTYAKSGSFVTRTNAIGILGDIATARPSLSDSIAPVVIRGLDDPDHSGIVASEKAIQQMPPLFTKTALARLRELLKEGNGDLSWQAASAIGHLGPDASDCIPDLRSALSTSEPFIPDGPPQLRTFAALALGSIGPKAHVANDSLKLLLDDRDPNLKRAAEEALVKINATR